MCMLRVYVSFAIIYGIALRGNRQKTRGALCPRDFYKEREPNIMVNTTIKIENKSGLHARPASDFVKLASKFKSNITIIFNGKSINAKGVIGIMAAGIAAGSEIELQADGVDENEAIEKLTALIESGFGE